MSHFTVGVIVDNLCDVDKMLAPYDEKLEVAPYICNTRDELIQDAKSTKERIEKYIKIDKDYKVGEWDRLLLNAKSDEELYNAEIDSDNSYDKDGNEISTYNPNSKWDWYSIDGRWNRLLLTKNDGYKNYSKIKDIDYKKMEKKVSKEDMLKEEWELKVEKREPKNEKEKDIISHCPYNSKYYIERYGNKETFIKVNSRFNTYALLDENGWHQTGEMGWFGFDDVTQDSESKFQNYFDKAMKDKKNQDKYLVIVDCHI